MSDLLRRLAGLVALIPLSLWLVALFPLLIPLFLGLWVVSIFLDVRSTWRIYLLDPGSFPENESNVLFVAFYEKLGFGGAVAAFLALSEVPHLVFIGLFLAPLVGGLFFLSISPLAGLGVAAAAQGYAHLDGWRANRAFLSSKKELASVS